MKKSSVLMALPILVSLTASPTVALAASPPAKTASAAISSHLKPIYYNGKLTMRVYSVVHDGTTYMPVWYIQQILKGLGVTSTWRPGIWRLTVPALVPVSYSGLPSAPKKASKGTVSISINGTAVEYAPGITRVNPLAGPHAMTEFLPIWYVQQVLARFGVQGKWTGDAWHLTDGKAGESASSGSGVTVSTVKGSSSQGSSTTTSGAGTSAKTSSHTSTASTSTSGKTGSVTVTASSSGNASTSTAKSSTSTQTAASSSGATGSSKGSGQTTVAAADVVTMSKKTILVNGRATNLKPYGFVLHATTYMSLWYVEQALLQVGIGTVWRPGSWMLTAPKASTVDYSNLPAMRYDPPKDFANVTLDGHLVAQVPTSVQVDPDSNQPTVFIPIWYVQQVLLRMGVQSTWNGTTWNLQFTPPSAASTSTPTTTSSTSAGSTSGSSGSSGTTGSTSSSSGSSGTSSASGDGGSSSSGSTTSGGSSGATSGTGSSASSSGSGGSGTSSASGGGGNSSGSTSSSAATQPSSPPIAEYGDTGESVALLENDLNIVGDPVGSADGIFGPMTLAGVKKFQQQEGLPVTGVVDQTTWTDLQEATLQVEEKSGFQLASQGAPPSSQSSSSGQTGSSSGTANNSGSSGSPSSVPSGPSFTNVDLRFPAPSDINASSIDSYLSANSSPLTGLGSVFMQAQSTYGVDANYLVSHAILESYWGKSQIALEKNNLYGYGAYNSNPGNDAGMYPSDAYAIRFQAWEVRNNYLDPSGSLYVSPTLTGMNVNYATDPNWATDIGGLMNQFATSVGGSVSQYQQYTPNDSPPQPESTNEPVFLMDGATGVITQNSDYNGLPYYPTAGDGMSEMFFGTLQNGSIGSNVAAVQAYLNQVDNANLAVDGQYGPDTEAAVKQFQQQNNLPVTGEWTYQMWQKFNPSPAQLLPAGTGVEIDEMMQGMAGGLVVEWYHLVGYGWVDSQYVQMTNVYRVTVPDPTSTDTTVNVYSPSNPSQVLTTLHAGNFVVSTSPNGQNGMIPIQFMDQTTGQPVDGLISSTQATLTQQQ
ncbi:MAG: peptidoglycan-binding protein [Alicyclobacillaceae bacterium]|nr:peptidoglycan-binding protein [Alicyclobacillaceae bacterium]